MLRYKQYFELSNNCFGSNDVTWKFFKNIRLLFIISIVELLFFLFFNNDNNKSIFIFKVQRLIKFAKGDWCSWRLEIRFYEYLWLILSTSMRTIILSVMSKTIYLFCYMIYICIMYVYLYVRIYIYDTCIYNSSINQITKTSYVLC